MTILRLRRRNDLDWHHAKSVDSSNLRVSRRGTTDACPTHEQVETLSSYLQHRLLITCGLPNSAGDVNTSSWVGSSPALGSDFCFQYSNSRKANAEKEKQVSTFHLRHSGLRLPYGPAGGVWPQNVRKNVDTWFMTLPMNTNTCVVWTIALRSRMDNLSSTLWSGTFNLPRALPNLPRPQLIC